MKGLSPQRKLKSLVYLTASGVAAFCGISWLKNDENFYKKYLMPLVHYLEPETAHNFGILLCKHRVFPKSSYKDPDILKTTVFGKEISNPVGLAAGFDKDGKGILGLQDLGFGLIEIGSVTPLPQEGNERPRLFRLHEDQAVINRYGFNNEGHDKVLKRLEEVRKQGSVKALIGVNLGKNKTSEDPIKDYVEGIKKFGPLSDYLVINISSPNTPGLRTLQNKSNLEKLLTVLIKTRNEISSKTPLLIKIAPDLTQSELQDICDVITKKSCKIDGIIVSNTTTQRPNSLKSLSSKESGGLSGAPLKDKSTEIIAEVKKLTKNEVLIFGVGGVASGQDAFDKIEAGATVVQIYTSLVYEGPPVVGKIKRELSKLLQEKNSNK